MGITTFARGIIKSVNDIPLLIKDARKFAGENNWKDNVIDDDFDAPADAELTHRADAPGCVIEGSLGLKGIILNAGQGAEMLALLFDKAGVLTDLMQQVAWIQNDGEGERFTICKTQFGSIDTHIRIIELLDLIKKKYVPNLLVDDEGAYWESRDRRILAEKRVALGHALRRTEKIISGIELSEDEDRDPEAIASRIEDALLKAENEDGLERGPV